MHTHFWLWALSLFSCNGCQTANRGSPFASETALHAASFGDIRVSAPETRNAKCLTFDVVGASVVLTNLEVFGVDVFGGLLDLSEHRARHLRREERHLQQAPTLRPGARLQHTNFVERRCRGTSTIPTTVLRFFLTSMKLQK